MSFAGFKYANQGADDATRSMTNQMSLSDVMQQAKARAALAPLFARLAQGSGAGTAQPSAPGMPGLRAVSPQAPAMPPAGGASAGAGASNPAGGASSLPWQTASAPASFSAPSMAGFTPQQIAYAIQTMGMRGPESGYLLENALKMQQPQAALQDRLLMNMLANQTRRDIAGQNIASREKIAADNIGARERIAKANRIVRSTPAGGGNKPVNDPVFRALEDKVKAAQAANVAMASDETYQALLQASDALLEYAKSKKGDTAAPVGASAAPSVNAPAAGGTVSVISPDGTAGTIPADQLQDALAAGYKKAQ